VPTAETPCYTLEAERPALNYAVRSRPSAKQAAMCRMAVELHSRIQDLPTDGKYSITTEKKLENLSLVVNAFAVGGVQQHGDIQSAVDQLARVHRHIFISHFSPRLQDAKRRFTLTFLFVGIIGVGAALASSKLLGWTEVSNYIFLMVAAALGVTLVSAGTGLHTDFDAFEEDMIALRAPLLRMFVTSGVALVIALGLSTDAASLKLGNMHTTDIPSNTIVALTLGALFGVANGEALKLLLRFAGQAVGKIAAVSAKGKASEGAA
jgi:hypothetical protein